MSRNKEKLSGVFAPVVTPFARDEPDLDALVYNLTQLRKSRLTGYLALGSNGEYKSLTDRERQDVLASFAEHKGDKVVMVGTGYESTKETIEKSRVAAQMGFDYVSVLTPSYFAKRMDGETLRRYYEAVAEAVSVPLLLYNAPQFAGGVQIPATTIVELSRHENIVGIKDSSAAGPCRLLADLDSQDDFSVLAGSANSFYPSLHVGATGGVISLANVLPEACVMLYELFAQGLYERAQELHTRLVRLNQAISGTWGVAGVKAAMDLAGFQGGRPREPLLPAPRETIDQIRQALVHEGFLAPQDDPTREP